VTADKDPNSLVAHNSDAGNKRTIIKNKIEQRHHRQHLSLQSI